MRIGIVNDLFMAVYVLSALIERRTRHEIAWLAYDGAEAVKKCREDRPDIILMDLIMPVMDGVEATRLIMKDSPCAILIVTSNVSANLDKVYQAMGAGALDVVKTPSIDVADSDATQDDFIRKIETLTNFIGVGQNSVKYPQMHKVEGGGGQSGTEESPLLAIGASTGGPMALSKIFSRIPTDVPFATVVIQHLSEEFLPGLISWLNEQVSLNVRGAKEGERPQPGCVYLPERGAHLTLDRNRCFSYLSDSTYSFFKPSIDMFFHSAAAYWLKPSMGVLLTGMGDDGAQGLKHLRDKGWFTIAQDESTSVVYGMPRIAVEFDAASAVLPLDKIPLKIMECIGSGCLKAT